MKIGATGGLDRVDRLEELGFDLIEFSVGRISALSPEGWAKISGVLAGKNIAWHSCNGLFPGNKDRSIVFLLQWRPNSHSPVFQQPSISWSIRKTFPTFF